MFQTFMTGEQSGVFCLDGLCVSTVPEGLLSEKRLKLEDDEDLAGLKDELMRHMEATGAHSGVMLLAPALGARRFGPKPVSWLNERVGLEFSHSDKLVYEAEAMLQRYSDMVKEMAEGHALSEMSSIDS
jgi:hypothetical protein